MTQDTIMPKGIGSHSHNSSHRAPKKRKTTTTRPTTVVTKLARNRVTLHISAMVENTECTFQGNMPDPDNCQCKSHSSYFYEHSSCCFILAYYTCREDVITRIHCPDRQLFDEDNRLSNDFRKVFCGNRPIMNVELIHVRPMVLNRSKNIVSDLLMNESRSYSIRC